MKKDKITDRHISEVMKQQLPDAPVDQWFIKKTMNRLPEKRKRMHSTAEIISYTLSIMIIIAGWIWQLTGIYNSQAITIENILISVSLFFSAIILTLSIAIPIIKEG